MFGREDFAEMAEMLKTIKGRFILSINDRPEIRKLFEWARMETVQTKYTANAKAVRRAAELLIEGGGV